MKVKTTGLTSNESKVGRNVPTYSSRLVFWVKCGIIRSCVRCLPAFNGTYIHCGRGNWRRVRRLRWLRAVFLVWLYHCHSIQNSIWVVWKVEVIATRGNDPLLNSFRYGVVGSFESNSIVTICGSWDATDEIVITSLSWVPNSSVQFRTTSALSRTWLLSLHEDST